MAFAVGGPEVHARFRLHGSIAGVWSRELHNQTFRYQHGFSRQGFSSCDRSGTIPAIEASKSYTKWSRIERGRSVSHPSRSPTLIQDDRSHSQSKLEARHLAVVSGEREFSLEQKGAKRAYRSWK